MRDKTIKVLVVEPMKPCRVQEVADDLDALQAIVGGSIEAAPILFPSDDSASIVYNMNGQCLDLPPNRPLLDWDGQPYETILGTFFITGAKGENFASLTDDQIKTYKGLYDNLMSMSAEKPLPRILNSAEKKKGGPSHER